MRLAYLSCDFGVPVFAPLGASVHLREAVRALRRLGHEVQVFSPNLGDAPPDAAAEGLWCIPLAGFAAQAAGLLTREDTGRSPHLAREWRRLVYAEHVQRHLRPLLGRWRPDAIYERYSLFAYAGAELAGVLGVPFLLEVNAPLSLEAARHRELVLRHTAADLERRILEAADAVLVVSRALESWARELGIPAQRIRVLPNGVDPERFHPSVSGSAVRKRFGLEGKRVIVFVGSLKPWHDLDTLVAAMRELSASDPDVHLFVVGEGPRLAQLRAEPQTRVTCSGALEHAEVPACLAAADAVVVPYAKGGEAYFSPLKLFEAMAAARPIVGARVGQVAEVLTDGETGLLYEPGQPGDLAGKIRALLAAPARAAELGRAARRAVVANHTWDANARQISTLVQTLGERGSASP